MATAILFFLMMFYTCIHSCMHSKCFFPTASFKSPPPPCFHCLCCGVSPLSMSIYLYKPHETLSCSLWFCVCQNSNHHTFPSTHTHTHTHTHTQSIGVQSGKGLSVVLCEWPLLKQINRHWHVPPPTKRKQLKTIDPVPVSSMNMHVSLTFPWRGKERQTDRQTDRQTGVAALSAHPPPPQLWC